MQLRNVFVFTLVAVGVTAAVAACSSSGSDAADGAAGSGDGAGIDGGTGGGVGVDLDAASGSDASDDALTIDNACGAIFLEPEPVEIEETIETEITCTAEAPAPVALYIMLDNSGSMEDNNKWEDAVDALSEFVETDPASGSEWVCLDEDGNEVTPPATLSPPGAGSVSAAIQYFHPEGVGNNVDECDGSGHSTPAVAMGPLPDNADAIIDSLGDTGPDGDTPTVGALTGGIEYCAGYHEDNPDIQCVQVLVTDGQPNGCGLDSGNDNSVDPDSSSVLAPIAAQGFADGVLTFTIGMEGVSEEGFDLLDEIAIAGGSDCTPGMPGEEACNVTTSGSEGFLAALNAIRDTVQVSETSSETITTTVTERQTLACEWVIPEPPDGEQFDEDLVNVTIVIGADSERLGYVTAPADCPAAGGWYYDNADAPTRILVCPASCEILETVEGAGVQVLLGCATQPAIK